MTVLTMHDVTKTYGTTTALAGVDLRVERGEIVALLGPNGAGKTTIFEVLLGLVRPTSGSATVLGARPGSHRHRVGAMLQSAGLPDQMTVQELVGLVGRSYPRPRPLTEILERTSLTDRAGRTVTALSGGERQRLLLAMAIIGAPELLLLDEPTAAMDVASRRAFWRQAHASVADGATILFATHDMHEAEAIADRVVVVARGRILADAAPQDLALPTAVASQSLLLTPAATPQDLALTSAYAPATRPVPTSPLEEVFLALTEESPTDHEGALR